ncbi:hypothetical protein [Klebsiella pneumoniae]|nr:hypothetical protein [Klebsiella pneumoniae]MCD8728176.1 hypothetical protein [Klebsiella pneumoniae]
MYFGAWRLPVAGRQKIMSLFSRQRVSSDIIAEIVYCGF